MPTSPLENNVGAADDGFNLSLHQPDGTPGNLRGSIRLRDGARPIISLFETADPSTFGHESAHAWLEDLFTDAAHPQAPAELRADAETVRAHYGIEAGAAPSVDAHERFAQDFEQYLAQGRAPSSALAQVFERFKQWLVNLYQTATKLGLPVNDDIKAVFDRMLARPEPAVGDPVAQLRLESDRVRAEADAGGADAPIIQQAREAAAAAPQPQAAGGPNRAGA